MRAENFARDEAGSSTSLALLLGVALIILPVLVLVLALPTWEQRVVDADDAARAASRSLAASGDWAAAVSAAQAAVLAVADGNDLPPGAFTEDFGGSLEPGGQVTASVTVAVPVGELPGLGTVGTLHYTAVSTAHVDSYEDSPS